MTSSVDAGFKKWKSNEISIFEFEAVFVKKMEEPGEN